MNLSVLHNVCPMAFEVLLLPIAVFVMLAHNSGAITDACTAMWFWERH